MLTRNLIKVNQRARAAAEANLEQVQKFYDFGGASELDLLRAKSRFSSTLPPLTSAINSHKISKENLKFVMNLTPDDSLIVLDTLREMNFLGSLHNLSLTELQQLAVRQRPDLKAAEYQKRASGDQRIVSASRFLPSVSLVGNVQHQAQVENWDVQSNDFIRSKSIAVNIQLPLFQGGKRVLDYQQARINTKKAQLQLEYFEKSILLEVEKSYLNFQETNANLNSLRQGMIEAGEALRMANLTYQEGLSTQVDVLTAQLAFTNSEVQFQQGIYQYNFSQLQLLKSTGKLNDIWNNQQ